MRGTVEVPGIESGPVEVLGPDRVLVPGNRWDLLPAAPDPTVTVVVTHFEQPAQLARVLAALDGWDVVVADDGSAAPPQVPRGVQLVQQPDLGFRAAAARNLGASVATGRVLVFLDADIVPEPGFVPALVRHAAASPDVLAVGRRHHADLSGDGRELPAPAWLSEGLAQTHDLLEADGRSFRFVISAVLACRRELFEDLGGFDERFVGYGGEDWDLAFRAWNNGALLVHEPGAVAVHDGPDWGTRDGDPARKDAESARLAALVPDPLTRGAPMPALLPDVLVDVMSYDVRCVHALLAQDHRDLQVRVQAVDEVHRGQVRTEPWTTDQERRARVRVRLDQPVALAPGVLSDAVRRVTEAPGRLVLTVAGEPVGTVTSTRALGRARRWPDVADVVERCFGTASLEVATLERRQDLAGFLAAAGQDGVARWRLSDVGPAEPVGGGG